MKQGILLTTQLIIKEQDNGLILPTSMKADRLIANNIKQRGVRHAVQELFAHGGYTVDQILHIISAFETGNGLLQAAEELQELTGEKIVNLLPKKENNTPQITTLAGKDILDWLSLDPLNLRNLISAYRMVYGNSDWKEGARLKDGLNVTQQSLARKYEVKNQYSYIEFVLLYQQVEISERDVLMSMFDEYYPADEMKPRLESEFRTDENQYPIYIMSQESLERYEDIINGFAWATLYSDPSSATELAAKRIINANYSQTEALRLQAEEEERKLVESLLVNAENTRTPVVYIDEIAIIPEYRGTQVFSVLFANLIGSVARAGLDTGAESVTFMFRTMKGGIIDKITKYRLPMNVVYSSGSDDQVMVYKALTVGRDFMEMMSNPDMVAAMFSQGGSVSTPAKPVES